MRASSKSTILHAAVRLAESGGITGLTLDGVAAEAGISKGGLIYHFTSKEQLMLGVVEFICAQWELALLDDLDGAFADATPARRLLAYTRVVANQGPGRAELAILVDAVHHEELLVPWRMLLSRWTAPTVGDPTEVDRQVARLAADGLWTAEATATTGLDDRMRAAVLDRIEQLAATLAAAPAPAPRRKVGR